MYMDFGNTGGDFQFSEKWYDGEGNEIPAPDTVSSGGSFSYTWPPSAFYYYPYCNCKNNIKGKLMDRIVQAVIAKDWTKAEKLAQLAEILEEI